METGPRCQTTQAASRCFRWKKDFDTALSKNAESAMFLVGFAGSVAGVGLRDDPFPSSGAAMLGIAGVASHDWMSFNSSTFACLCRKGIG